MRRRVIATGIMLALAVATPTCKNDKANPMLNKSPAVETIADAGPKKRVIVGDEKKKLSVVPKKEEKEKSAPPKKDVRPVPPNPFIQTKESKTESEEAKGEGERALDEMAKKMDEIVERLPELKVPELKRHPVYPSKKEKAKPQKKNIQH